MANTEFIVPGTPHIGRTKIVTTNAQVKSDGTSAGSAADVMYCAFDPAAAGSFLQRVRFNSVASAAATTGVATVLRVYISTVAATEGAAVGATTSANTFLLAEISVPAISSSHSINATTYFDVTVNIPLTSADHVHVSQHTAQTTNQQWQAIGIGGDY